MNDKRRYIKKAEADAIGLPNLSGHRKGDKVFLRYERNIKTGHIQAKYISLQTRKDCKTRNNRKKIAILSRYKKFVGCAFCGYREHSIALQFDHIDPKEKSFNISQSYKAKGMKALKKEIKKCQVLCANCHAVKTYENKDYLNEQNTIE